MSASVLIMALIAVRGVQLVLAMSRPVDALLVPGGTPYRERYAAKQSVQHPQLRVLISSGSADPCIWLIYDKAGAPKNSVWMEHCARNTFENFVYAIPILKAWHAHRVQIVSEQPQIERVRPMAQIMLGANGILAEPLAINNSSSEPLHHPVWMDVLASCAWVLPSQIIEPRCENVTQLANTNMIQWYKRGFYCAPQADVDSYRPSPQRLKKE